MTRRVPSDSVWKATIKAIPIGKRVGESVYLHNSALWPAQEGRPLGDIVDQAMGFVDRQLPASQERVIDIVKFSQRKPVVSLLCYPTFFEDAFPAINHAYTVDLKAGTVKERDYSKYTNKPILHRKELFLAKDHPRYEEFAAITRTIEDLGLFCDTKRIGYEWAWGRRLADAGVKVFGNQIISPCPTGVIA